MELKSMQQHSQNNSTVLVFQKYPPEVINSAVTPYNHLSHRSKKKTVTSMYVVQKVFKDTSFLKVAFSQKILKNFFVAKINIPNHYPEQKI